MDFSNPQPARVLFCWYIAISLVLIILSFGVLVGLSFFGLRLLGLFDLYLLSWVLVSLGLFGLFASLLFLVLGPCLVIRVNVRC